MEMKPVTFKNDEAVTLQRDGKTSGGSSAPSSLGFGESKAPQSPRVKCDAF